MYHHSSQPQTYLGWQHLSLILGATALIFGLVPGARAQETIGGGTVSSPAVGPAPTFLPPELNPSAMPLVKNWHFGIGGTIKNQADLNANFQYHDQHNNIANGSNAYGALIVAPDDANAINPGDVYYYDDNGTPRGAGTGQPIEGRDSAPVRQFTADSIKTFLTPLSHATTMVNGVLTVLPDRHEVGCGSFMPKWFLPAGGSLLGQDIVWETKVRYVTPAYFWFSLWTDGNQWRWDNGARGAEHDLIESYGEDYASEGAGTSYGNNNFDGHLWHSNSVAGSDTVNYFTGGWWGAAMAGQGVTSYDATQYHIWTWVYKHDDTYAMYVDGKMVQNGTNYFWTFGNRVTDVPINMDFRFDAAWGHLSVKQVDKPLPASALAGTYYEFNYSHVYLSQPYPYSNPVVSLPGTIRAVNYETGGSGIAYNQTAGGGQTLYRSDNSGADYGTALGWTAAGQWYKYKVTVATAGLYNFSFQAGSSSGGTFHVEDENGVNLTGTITAPSTGGTQTYGLVVSGISTNLSAGPHVLKWVQDTGGYDLYSMTATFISNSLINGSFETPSVNGAYSYNPTGGGWTFAGNAGIQANGSAWGAAAAPDGTQTAFLQGSPTQGAAVGSISQMLTFPAAGTYALTFQAARRNGQIQPVQVKLDGTNQGNAVTPESSVFSPQSVALTVGSGGAHTLVLCATASAGDNSTFVDKIALAPAVGPLFTEGFESGSLNSWSLWTGSNGAAAYASSSTSEAHTGSWGYVNWSSNPYQLTLYRTISVPNGPHTVSAWVKSSGGQTACRMEVTANGGTTYVQIPASSAWTQISTTVSVTSGSVEIGFYSFAGGGQWMNVDDVAVN